MKTAAKLMVPLLAAGLAGLGAWAFQVRRAPPASSHGSSLATLLPPGALLSIESPNFADALRRWNTSAEQKAWLASDDYRVFSNSRLFSRLDDARAEFESAAKPAPGVAGGVDGAFLTQVAGGQSIFAWYDVGKLEFLYITRMPSEQAARIVLLKSHSGWTARQAGGSTFYMRQSSKTSAASSDDGAESAQGKARTVAFADVPGPDGDLVLLSTREDLMANALQLVRPAAGANSLATEQWFVDASAELNPAGGTPSLHTVLNLERLVPLPYFRSYWVQGNVSEMKKFRAAASDLYLAGDEFREERALLPRMDFEAASADAVPRPDLVSLAAAAPPGGVFRATSTTDPEAAIRALEEKLLGRATMEQLPARDAPGLSPATEASGSATDLETRIDTPAPVLASFSNEPLVAALRGSGLDAVLTWSSAIPPATPEGLWVPLHSAVILHGSSPFSVQSMASALQASLRGSLTAASLGIEFHTEQAGGATFLALAGPKSLFLATAPGNRCLFADDRATLLALLSAPAQASEDGNAVRATTIAGFDHAGQRIPLRRLTSLIDGTNQTRLAATKPDAPAFFSGDLGSLSDAFGALASERFTERRDGKSLHQTVIYRWRAP